MGLINKDQKKNQEKQEQIESGLPSNMAVLESLKRELEGEILRKIEANTPRGEFDALKRRNEELEDVIKDLREQNMRMDARTSNFNKDLATYPIKTRGKAVQNLEKMFNELGVGTRTMRFIRKKYSGELLIKSSAVLTRDNEVIRLMYTTNHESPFVDDHPQSAHWIPETEPIRFRSTGVISSIDVPASNPCLQRFLIANPSFGSGFYLEDREQIAREQNKKEDAIIEALLTLEKMFKDQEFNVRIFAVHALKTQQPLIDAVRLSLEELKRELRSSLKANPGLIDSFKHVRSDCQLRYLYQKSLDEGLIEVSGSEIRTQWNNERLVIIRSVPDYDFAKAMVHKRDMVEILKEKTHTTY